MRHIYSFLLYLSSPYLLLRLWWKARRLPSYSLRIPERFSLDKGNKIDINVWIHAVSLGEVIAASPLIEVLLAKKLKILITTMTPTGLAQIVRGFDNKVLHQYIPYDLAFAQKRFFKKIRPQIGLIMETELWPNLIHYASKSQIPLMLINARLSERSYLGYTKIRFLLKPILNKFTAILTQSDDDTQRFKNLGATDNKVITLGNIKYNLKMQNLNNPACLDLKTKCGNTRPIIILASTHEHEEQLILTNLQQLYLELKDYLILIAPRHPERFEKVYQLSVSLGFNTKKRSQLSSLEKDTQVVILDSLGELLGFYQISDYAFVGGSLVNIGGHNILEPISLGIPVLTGPYMHNFKTICRDLHAANGLSIANNASELINKIIDLHNNSSKRNAQINQATFVFNQHKNVLANYTAKIESVYQSVTVRERSF